MMRQGNHSAEPKASVPNHEFFAVVVSTGNHVHGDSCFSAVNSVRSRSSDQAKRKGYLRDGSEPEPKSFTAHPQHQPHSDAYPYGSFRDHFCQSRHLSPSNLHSLPYTTYPVPTTLRFRSHNLPLSTKSPQLPCRRLKARVPARVMGSSFHFHWTRKRSCDDPELERAP